MTFPSPIHKMAMLDDRPQWLIDLLEKYDERSSPALPEIVWRNDVRRGVSRLPAVDTMIVERAIEGLRRDLSVGKNALDYCDAFAEISAGRYKIFYQQHGNRIEITGLARR